MSGARTENENTVFIDMDPDRMASRAPHKAQPVQFSTSPNNRTLTPSIALADSCAEDPCPPPTHGDPLFDTKTQYNAAQYEILSRYAAKRLAAGSVALLVALITIGFAFAILVPGLLFIWSTLLVATLIWLLSACHEVCKHERAAINVRAWRYKLLAYEVLHGLVWGMLPWVPMLTGVPFEPQLVCIVFVLTAQIIVVAFGSLFYGCYLSVSLAVVLPITFSTVVKMFVIGAGPITLGVVVVAVASAVLFVCLGRRMFSISLRVIRLQLEKDSLIGELKHAKTVSDRARRRAEDASMAKSRFLAAMSHELRTPLNAILGFSEIMKTQALGPLGNDVYREYSNDIHGSGSRLLHYLDNILDFSRIETGRYKMHSETVELTELIDAEVQHLLLAPIPEGITFNRRYAANLPAIWADSASLRKIIAGLLRQAIMASGKGSVVEIEAGLTATRGLYLSIIDGGPRMSDEEIHLAVAMYNEGAWGGTKDNRGGGPYLYVCRHLAELHDGTLNVTNEAGRGVKYLVVFPRYRTIMAPEPVNQRDKEPACQEPARQLVTRGRFALCCKGASECATGTGLRCGDAVGFMNVTPNAHKER